MISIVAVTRRKGIQINLMKRNNRITEVAGHKGKGDWAYRTNCMEHKQLLRLDK